MLVTSKTGFDPSQTSDIQAFNHFDRWYGVSCQGAVLDTVGMLGGHEAGVFMISTVNK